MKTKSLILTALVTLASGVGVMAQSVYSQNIVGYVSQVVPAGYSIMGNQMKSSTDNKVTTIFGATTPDQTTVFKFNRSSGSYLSLTYFAGAGWFGDDDQMTLNPGEAAFVYAPSKFTNTFLGEVVLSSTNALQTGYQIVGSVLPIGGQLGSTNLNFPAVDQAQVFRYNNGSYISDTYFAGAGWFGDSTDGSNSPNVAVGEGYFVYVPSNANWVQTYTVGQ